MKMKVIKKRVSDRLALIDFARIVASGNTEQSELERLAKDLLKHIGV